MQQPATNSSFMQTKPMILAPHATTGNKPAKPEMNNKPNMNPAHNKEVNKYITPISSMYSNLPIHHRQLQQPQYTLIINHLHLNPLATTGKKPAKPEMKHKLNMKPKTTAPMQTTT